MPAPDWQRLAQARGRELANLRLALDRAPKLRGGAKTLRPVRANLGNAALYRRRLDQLIADMDASVAWFLRASYRANPPAMAQDAPAVGLMMPAEEEPGFAWDDAPALELKRAVGRLRRRWLRRFNDASLELARWFAKKVWRRSDRVLQKILRDGGWSVDFKMTAAQRDVLHAAVAENVALIKSIPQRYFTDVEGAVMRSVAAGRDLQQLTKDIGKLRVVTRRRAELIARDQNNKVNAALTRARYTELGIAEAIWVHSHAGKRKRPTHLKNDGKKYNVKRGWFDPDPRVRRYIQPGELISCRCFSRPVVPGFS